MRGIIGHYKTMFDMFQTIYPEHKWDLYQFLTVPQGHASKLLENPVYQKEFVDYLEKKFNIKQTSDWYRITKNQIREVIHLNLSTVMSIVKNFYPELNLKNFEFGKSLTAKKSQYTLKSMINELFPNEEILEDYRHADLDYLELDYYLPNLKLAFEYQVINFYFLYLYLFFIILFYLLFLTLYFLVNYF